MKFTTEVLKVVGNFSHLSVTLAVNGGVNQTELYTNGELRI